MKCPVHSVENVDRVLPFFIKAGRTVTPGTDPTQTKVLRGQMVTGFNERYSDITQVVAESVIKNDVFGLNAENVLSPMSPEELAGLTPNQQSREFMKQMRVWEQQSTLQGYPVAAGEDVSDAWTNAFLAAAYSKGLIKGNADVRALGVDVPILNSGNVAVKMAQPATKQRMNVIFTAFVNSELEITEAMNLQVADQLLDGFNEGLGTTQIAKNINDRVDKVGLTRSRMISRTEIVRTRNLAAVDEYGDISQIIGEEVLIQWQATLDSRVRASHEARHGNVYRWSEYVQLIGEPNCRCAGLPYIVSIEGEPEEVSTATETRTQEAEAAEAQKEAA